MSMSKQSSSEITQIRPISEYVFLDVGGQFFSPKKSTLVKYPESMLAKLVDDKYDKRQNKTDVIAIHRDPKHFRWILDYLRGSPQPWPINNEELQELISDLDFYSLDEIHTIGENILARNAKVTNLPVLVSEQDINDTISANRGLIFIMESNTYRRLINPSNDHLKHFGSLNCKIYIAIDLEYSTRKLEFIRATHRLDQNAALLKLNCFYSRDGPKELLRMQVPNPVIDCNLQEIWMNMSLNLAAEYTRLRDRNKYGLPYFFARLGIRNEYCHEPELKFISDLGPSQIDELVSDIAHSSEFPVIRSDADLIHDVHIKKLITYKLFQFVITESEMTNTSECYASDATNLGTFYTGKIYSLYSPGNKLADKRCSDQTTLWLHIALTIDGMISKLNHSKQ